MSEPVVGAQECRIVRRGLVEDKRFRELVGGRNGVGMSKIRYALEH